MRRRGQTRRGFAPADREWGCNNSDQHRTTDPSETKNAGPVPASSQHSLLLSVLSEAGRPSRRISLLSIAGLGAEQTSIPPLDSWQVARPFSFSFPQFPTRLVVHVRRTVCANGSGTLFGGPAQWSPYQKRGLASVSTLLLRSSVVHRDGSSLCRVPVSAQQSEGCRDVWCTLRTLG